MADIFSKKKRSELMSRIRSNNTKPELILKSILDGRIFRYQPKYITGKPDFASKKRKIAIFVDGCFWHGCKKCKNIPKNNKIFWSNKIKRNKKRDKEINKKLKDEGYKVFRFWEHSVRKNPSKIAVKIKNG